LEATRYHVGSGKPKAMLPTATYLCPVCAQPNETTVDPSQGNVQSYVEDCQVCCRPLILSVELDEVEPRIVAVAESD
jgi:hypothetical protein